MFLFAVSKQNSIILFATSKQNKKSTEDYSPVPFSLICAEHTFLLVGVPDRCSVFQTQSIVVYFMIMSCVLPLLNLTA